MVLSKLQLKFVLYLPLMGLDDASASAQREALGNEIVEQCNRSWSQLAMSLRGLQQSKSSGIPPEQCFFKVLADQSGAQASEQSEPFVVTADNNDLLGNSFENDLNMAECKVM